MRILINHCSHCDSTNLVIINEEKLVSITAGTSSAINSILRKYGNYKK